MFDGNSRARSSGRGFTLLEALIALLITSLGMLGVAAMHIQAMQNVHLAYQRSIATLAAQDGVERLWLALGEGRGRCPDAVAVKSAWLDHWSPLDRTSKLPDMRTASDIHYLGACEYTLTVAWNDERFAGEDVATLTYLAKLPGQVPTP